VDICSWDGREDAEHPALSSPAPEHKKRPPSRVGGRFVHIWTIWGGGWGCQETGGRDATIEQACTTAERQIRSMMTRLINDLRCCPLLG
jgi:hypothetical protein